MSFSTSDFGQWLVDREVQRALRGRVAIEFVGELSEDRSAERQVAQVIVECGKARNDLAIHTEGRNAIRDHLLRLRKRLQDRAAERFQCAALGLLDTAQILVDVLAGYGDAV